MPESVRGIMPDPDPEWGDSLTWWWLMPQRQRLRRQPVMVNYRRAKMRNGMTEEGRFYRWLQNRRKKPQAYWSIMKANYELQRIKTRQQ